MLEKAEGRGKVRFSVFDAESGEPVPGASVGRLAARGDACFSIGYSATQDGKEALVKSRRFLEPLLN